jgi:hypothetical protein
MKTKLKAQSSKLKVQEKLQIESTNAGAAIGGSLELEISFEL